MEFIESTFQEKQDKMTLEISTIRKARERCERFSKLTIKTPERHQWRHPDVVIVNFEHV